MQSEKDIIDVNFILLQVYCQYQGFSSFAPLMVKQSQQNLTGQGDVSLGGTGHCLDGLPTSSG
ncbi:MAG: hypothetical protein IPO65_20030 [Saprospiraceae bacterium]|nr:hypothetical protein [Saprospiraceae bacterium]